MTTNLKLFLLLLLGPGSAFAQGNSAVLLSTFTNPTPAPDDFFGESVTALGSDRVLIGGEGAGEVYLYGLNGALLTTFTDPAPSIGGGFGYSVAAVGSDRVLIGSYSFTSGVPPAQVGAAYLFTTNGTLLTTFTNPNPTTVQGFGFSLAALGSDRVLISGVPNPNKPAPYPGGAYLFSTNGTLLTRFTNPTPAQNNAFGISVATIMTGRVLIGAPNDNTGASRAGAAYLFSTNGTLLTAITNPSPAISDNFGQSVATVSGDRVLVGASDYGGSKGTGGAAYLFSTNGGLLTTFTNPTPAAQDYFGYTVGAVGSSRVLIGAYQDGTGAFQAGSAYLFSTNGTLLNTFTNPTPATSDWFGFSVAAVGSDRVIIGAPTDNTGASHAGSAYIYALPYPPLNIARSAGTILISWVTSETGLILQQADLLGAPTGWSNTTSSVSINSRTNVVQQALATTNRFFRLHRP